MYTTNIYPALDDYAGVKETAKLNFIKKYRERFQEYDRRSIILANEKEIMTKIFSTPISQAEYQEALEKALNIYGADFEWFCQSEARDIVYDLKRISHGLVPIMSTTFTEPIIVGHSLDPIDEKDIMLPEPIALLCEWQVNNEWKSQVVSIMKTVKDFWMTYQCLEDTTKGTDCCFSLPLVGNMEKSIVIFDSLIASSKRMNGSEDDTVDVNDSNIKNVSTIVSSYNALFPVWSFIKVKPDTIMESDIVVPFIKDQDGQKKINEININLKDTKFNIQHGIYCIDPEFTKGYIPRLILSFISGNLPSQINAIVFSKTIAVNSNTYFRGYRVRILTETTEYLSLIECRDYLQTTFIKKNWNDYNYSRCVVRINIPRAKK